MSAPLERSNISDIIVYEPGRPIDEVAKELGLSDVIKLASNENALGISPIVAEAVRDAIAEIHRYPDGGAVHLREKLSSFYNWPVEGIVLGNGSNDLIEMAAKAFLAPQDKMILSEKTFVVYPIVAKLMDIQTEVVPMQDYTHDVLAMAERMDDRTKLVAVCSPNNPTGTANQKQDLEELIDRAEVFNTIVLLDEAYAEYAAAFGGYEDGLSFLNNRKNVIIFRTFSKIYALAGLRVGYTLTTPELAQSLEKIRQPFNVNYLAQVAACAALEDQDHVIRSRDLNKSEMEKTQKHLEALGLKVVDSVCNFLLIDLNRDTRTITDALLKKGVIVRPVDGYGLPGHIRVTIGLPEENNRFLEALKDVLEAYDV